MTLTESQSRAIEHDGRNLQLVACAGSGKTEVPARRVVHLLTPGRQDSLVPANIVEFEGCVDVNGVPEPQKSYQE